MGSRDSVRDADIIRVLLLCRYERNGASSRLRFLQYIPELQTRGICVTVAPFFDSDYLSRLYSRKPTPTSRLLYYFSKRFKRLTDSNRFDLIWLEQEALPWLPFWCERMWLKRTPYVLDLDDAWFQRYACHPRAFVRRALSTKLENIARGAAAVVVGNEYLAAWARELGARHVVHIPTATDLDCAIERKSSGRPFTIGWLGTPLTARYVQEIAKALGEVCSLPDTRLRLVGAGKNFTAEDFAYEIRAWSEESETEELSKFDVGIAPLPDRPWERGKSGFKIIRYMAAALPVVASPVGANASIVIDGETGFLVRTADEWVAALERLRADPSLRWRMGQAGRARAEEQYSTSAHIDRLAETLLRASRTKPLVHG